VPSRKPATPWPLNSLFPRLTRKKFLPLLLVGALLLCHGVFGALHLVCYLPECAGDAEHAAEHQAAAGAVDDAHEHPPDHGTSTEYFAVVLIFGFLGLLLGLLPKGTSFRIRLGMRWPVVLRRVPAVLRPPPTPTPLTLQVFRL
jgi:hypothetical protein